MSTYMLTLSCHSLLLNINTNLPIGLQAYSTIYWLRKVKVIFINTFLSNHR